MIEQAAAKAGKAESAYVPETVDEKLGRREDRESVIRQLAGWLSHEEAGELRESLAVSG